ncbi:MAG: cupin domain-containing protein [Candidatus Scalinduaceae bacterium]
MIHPTFFNQTFKILMIILSLIITGCKTVQKPSEFVESLRNPTSFPKLFFPDVKNTREIAKKNVLAKDENIKVIPIGENKNTSIHLVQVRQDAEIEAHFHKHHDELVYVKKGGGILELDGTRYSIGEGMMVVIPRMTGHKFVNTGGELNVAISIFSPPFDGEDIQILKETKKLTKKKKNIYEKGIKEREKEKKSKGKRFSLWKKKEKKVGLTKESREQASKINEQQKTLVLTEEGKQRIKEVQQVIKEEERRLIEKLIMNEKLKVLQKLKDDGLISQEEYEVERSELIGENK